MQLKIRRRDDVESLTTLEEGEFKVPIDGCINSCTFLLWISNQAAKITPKQQKHTTHSNL